MADTIEAGVMRTYARADEVFDGGEGAVLRTADGREFLDFLAGIAVNALGHAHPRLTEALRDQVGRTMHLSNLFRHSHTEPVATALCERAHMHKAFFCNSGAEAIECALKIARKSMRVRGTPERSSFVALEGGFHGRTLGALSLTHAEKYRAPFGPLLDVAWTAPEDLDGLERTLKQRQPAALVLEPIQGEGGVRELSGAFLQGARRLCDETGTVLVHDEIQAGCGRTGRFLAAQHHDVTPDVVALAKPIGAGLPMGVCLAREPFSDALQPGDHGTTFGGGPLVCRAAEVFLDELGDGSDGSLLGNARARGEQLRRGLEAIAKRRACVAEVRGRGLMLGLRLDRPAAPVQQALHAEGLLINCTAGDVLRIVPPYVVTEAQVERGLALIDAALTALDS